MEKNLSNNTVRLLTPTLQNYSDDFPSLIFVVDIFHASCIAQSKLDWTSATAVSQFRIPVKSMPSAICVVPAVELNMKRTCKEKDDS